MNIYQRILEKSRQTPQKTSCIYQQQNLTYQALIERVDNLCDGLLSMGVAQQSKIALICPNNLQFVVTLIAVAKLGAAVAPLPLTLKGKALKRAIKDMHCDVIIALPNVLTVFNEREYPHIKRVSLSKTDAPYALFDELIAVSSAKTLPVADVNSPYILTMTSGSTGAPKPIVFSQQTKINRAFIATKDYYKLTENDVILVSTPMYHSLAQRSILLPLMMGATAVILPKFTVQAWLHAVSHYQVSFLFSVSAQLVALLSSLSGEQDFSHLKCLVSSSATLSKTDKNQLLNHLNCHFHECYGASEVGVVTDFDITQANVPIASVGKPLPGIKVKICAPDRSELPNGEIGEIACLTQTRFVGYYELPDKTADSFDEHGYFYTGDLGYVDPHGYLYFVGRTKEVIKSGGINVFPSDIEAVINALPEIKECAAIGVDNAHFGEVIYLTYVLADGVESFDENTLRFEAMKELTDYQQPQQYVLFKEFPKSALGKILKPEIKKQLVTT